MKNMEKYQFKKGWKNLRYDDRKAVMSEIMEVLNIKTLVSFHRRKRGIPAPRMDEVDKINKIFEKYDVPKDKVWGV
jgi:hypothetical protein